MSAQEQPVKKRRFLLRIFQIRGRNRRNQLDARRHGEIAVYRKSFPRQVVLRPTRRVPINSPTPQPASGSVGFSLRSNDPNPTSRLNPQSAHPTLRHAPRINAPTLQPTSGSVGFSLRSYDQGTNLPRHPQSARPKLRPPPESTHPLPSPP